MMKKIILIALLPMMLVGCKREQPKDAEVTELSQESLLDDDMAEYDPNDFLEYCAEVDYSSLPDPEMLHTCESSDGKLTFYCWNTGLGGTSPDFAVYASFRTASGRKQTVALLGEPGWVSHVYTIVKTDGSTYYLTSRSHKASSADGCAWVDGFRIDGDSLRCVNPTDGGPISKNDIVGGTVEYCIPDWYYRTNGDGWAWVNEYDAQHQDLYVPEVDYEFSYGAITDRYEVYHFDGERFQKVGNRPHRGLSESLQSYVCLKKFFRTKNYTVRVDSLDNGQLRYASWKQPKTISDEPDLVLVGGKADEDDCFTFINDGVEYTVPYVENVPEDDGLTYHHEYLRVRRGEKVLLKEESIQ